MGHVVYVHGLWLPGEESLILRHRLSREFGLTLQTFRYSAASASMGDITARLASFVRELRSEEHTSELQSPCNLVCRLLLEKKKKSNIAFLRRIRSQFEYRYCIY